MERQFIQFNTGGNAELIAINKMHIAWIKADKDGGTDIYLDMTSEKDSLPKFIKVNEDYDTVYRSIVQSFDKIAGKVLR